MDSEPERVLYSSYFKLFFERFRDSLPALILQVYLHYDPYTLAQLEEGKRLPRQCMDFLLLFPIRRRVVIEIDGKHHYSTGDKSSPLLYAEMVSEDRSLKLAGYEVYRFGGYEFVDDSKVQCKLERFFERLFQIYSVKPVNMLQSAS